MANEVCDYCREDYPVWFTDNDIWNKYSSGRHFLCPTCFTLLAEIAGCKTTGWYITVEERAAIGAQPATIAVDESSAVQHTQLAIAARAVVTGFYVDQNIVLFKMAMDELRTALKKQAGT